MKPRQRTVIELVNKFGLNSTNSGGQYVKLGRLSPEDLQGIVDSLAANAPITDLILSGSHIGDEGVLLIAEALCKNTNLVSLKLADTGMTNKGVRALLDMLVHNQTLLYVDINQNDVSQTNRDRLKIMLAENQEFQLPPRTFSEEESFSCDEMPENKLMIRPNI